MTTARVLAVFGDDQGNHGSKVAVVVDGHSVPERRRTWYAAELGMEVGFIDDTTPVSVSVFDSDGRLPIAAQPVLAAAWLLRRLGLLPERFGPPSTPVTVGASDDKAWVGIPLSAVPDRVRMRLTGVEEIDALTVKSATPETYYWACEYASPDTVHARWFSSDSGAEEITVAPVLGLAAELGRPITVRQCGAEVNAESTADGFVVLAGRVRSLDSRSLTPPT